MAEEINWDEAIGNSGFVKVTTDESKTLLLTNHRLEKVDKFGEEQIEFQADVVEEDNNPVSEKLFTTTSNRLKKKLRPIFENKKDTDKTKISILMVGEKFDTQYSVKEV